LWVVNDSSTDKVFKYSLGGTLVGSWTISSANSKPTGLTIDPAKVSDIWIVDSGTDRVYQYTAAAGRTSGSQNAAASFALASGNTNPQGIADPPPSGTAIPRALTLPLPAERPAATARNASHRARERYFDELSVVQRVAQARGDSRWLDRAFDRAARPRRDAGPESEEAADLAFSTAWL
jgi:hypothetical protein